MRAWRVYGVAEGLRGAVGGVGSEARGMETAPRTMGKGR
jgi:hypothetical protein